MKETNLKIAQQDIEDALSAIETLEKEIDGECMSKDCLKEKFLILSNKLQELEQILKEEGII